MHTAPPEQPWDTSLSSLQGISASTFSVPPRYQLISPSVSISKNTRLCQTGQQGLLLPSAHTEHPSSEPDAAFVHLSSKETKRDGYKTWSDFCRERLMLLALQLGAEQD